MIWIIFVWISTSDDDQSILSVPPPLQGVCMHIYIYIYIYIYKNYDFNIFIQNLDHKLMILKNPIKMKFVCYI